MRDELRCPPDRILGVLEFLETRWGVVAGYLEASGVTPADIDRLNFQARLTRFKNPLIFAIGPLQQG